VTEAVTEAPLAARMRPRTLDQFVGQSAIVGEGRLLRRAIQADQLSSLIFYGPPGTGKTTLAQIIANTTRSHFLQINAVLSGVKDIRDAIAIAQDQQRLQQQRTILFIDEVHRFNKAQQDALLPWVENGTIILIGATTENPYFEVNKALVSRSRLFQLKPLEPEDLRQVVVQTLQDGDRGYGKLNIQIDDDALNHLVNVANGDARSLLNALELAVETTAADASGTRHITLTVAEESIQQRAVLYDKEGDVHFDTISAFIKSLRGSDPDAALYWLAKMIYAGEDPRFIFRRMLILAGEDVGLADPNAIVVVQACAAAFDRVGMPEGRYPLAQATLYLSTCPKSNSVMGFFDALASVERETASEVPVHLRDANRDKKGFGHGANYLYPHAYRDHWVAQQYLPTSLQGQVFYQPSNQGYEQQIQHQVERQREAQLAALVEGINVVLPEVLTFSPTNRTSDRWLQRTLNQTGERLAELRDRLFALAHPQRHHIILDLNGGSGLLTWEAVRQVPEGGVYTCVPSATDAQALQEQAQALPNLLRPIAICTSIANLSTQLTQQYPQLRCDRIIGRNSFAAMSDATAAEKLTLWRSLVTKLQPEGQIVLAESLVQQTQRIYELVDRSSLAKSLVQKWIKAEEAMYQTDSRLNWGEQEWRSLLEAAGLKVDLQVESTQTELRITAATLERWFSSGGDRSSYQDYLGQHLSEPEVSQVKALVMSQLMDQSVEWRGAIAFIVAIRS
jgi:putative ATPase